MEIHTQGGKKAQSETQAYCLHFPQVLPAGDMLLSAGCHLYMHSALPRTLIQKPQLAASLGLPSRMICDVLLLVHLSLVIYFFTLPCYVFNKPTHSKLKIQLVAHSPDLTEQASPRGRKSGH